MLQTIADDIWGQPCLAHHVQPHLSPETQDALAGLQNSFAELWPVPIHLGPPDALHVTLYALSQVKEHFDKEAYWNSIAGPCRELLEKLCTGHGALELRFSRLKITDVAIIAVATEETGLIETIRNEIADRIPLPPGRGKPLRYDLIHTTLARYRTSAAIPESVVEAVEGMPISVSASIERIKIIRETLFPCQVRDELHSFPLR